MGMENVITGPTMTFELYKVGNPNPSPLSGPYTLLLRYIEQGNQGPSELAVTTTITLTDQTGSVAYSGNWTNVTSYFNPDYRPLDLTGVTAESLGISYTGQGQSYNGSFPAGSASGTHYLLIEDSGTAQSQIETALGQFDSIGPNVDIWHSTSLSEASAPWVILEVIDNASGNDEIRLVEKYDQWNSFGMSWTVTDASSITLATFTGLSASDNESYNISWDPEPYSGIYYLLTGTAMDVSQTFNEAMNTLGMKYGQAQEMPGSGSGWSRSGNTAYSTYDDFVVLEIHRSATGRDEITLLQRVGGAPVVEGFHWY
jgi:hypothetical protein